MARYLLEVEHSAEALECLRAIQIFLKTGSHYLTHAEWGCKDGDHKAWMIVDVDTKQDALTILPPAYRTKAKVVGLTKFALPEIEEALQYHTA
jgi:hypothetical protein